MKITETIERDCCQPNDLKPYRPEIYKGKPRPVKFCQHCGRIWEWERKAGEMDYGYEPVALPFELPKVYPTDK